MSGLTDEERELKRLAEGADKEKWRTYRQDRRYVENENGDSIAEAFVGSGSGYAARVANAEYIAAASPATVLQLLSRIEELDARLAANDRLQGIPKGNVDALIAHLERAEDVAFEMAAKAVEAAPASFNRNDMAEHIRGLKAKRRP